MTCPFGDCQNNIPENIQANNYRIYDEGEGGKVDGLPACEYFCLNCQRYFYWVKGRKQLITYNPQIN